MVNGTISQDELVEGNLPLTTYIPYSDWLWLQRQCKELNTNRSEFLRKLIAEERARQQQTEPAPCSSN